MIIKELIELLNEYEGYKEDEFESWRLDENGYLTEGGDYFRIGTEMKVVSKAFGFIKWLVDNDKIDVNKVKKEFYNNICITEYGDEDRVMGDDNLVIAVLSISDSPINFLCSILK